MLDPTAQTIQVNAAFFSLTTPETAAHIHCCAPLGTNAGVATTLPAFPGFPLGVTSGTYVSPVFDLTQPLIYNPAFVTMQGGLSQAEAALIAGIENGMTYLIGPLCRLVAISLLCLLTLTTAASAECAWIAWRALDLDLNPTNWTLQSAWETKAQCERAAQLYADAAWKSFQPGGRNPGVASTKRLSDVSVQVTYKDSAGFSITSFRCIPDTIDPRRPKGN